MSRLLVYCEGATEELFIKDVLAPYLLTANIYAKPIGADGASKYSKIKTELTKLGKNDSQAIITTMFDYYALPNETPGVKNATGSLYEKIQHIESAVNTDLGLPNVFFNLIVHEFEGLLFADTTAFADIANETQLVDLAKIRQKFNSPEHINKSYETAPSRRILGIIQNYSKVLDGTKIAKIIGINKISAECPHFADWVKNISPKEE
ncbi:MAG: DUF4276 family protein [Defluviitaleaceae bacterium]|nr:DUF4276 family protein [Defluviitaleaceae bacterium]